MFRHALFSVLVVLLLAFGATTASAQGFDYNNAAAAALDRWGIPCPTGGCEKMLHDAKPHRKHHHQEAQNNDDEAVPQASDEDTSGYVGGRPFFSNNPNDQPK